MPKFEVSGYAKLHAFITVEIEAETEEDAINRFDLGEEEEQVYERLQDIGDIDCEADKVVLIEE